MGKGRKQVGYFLLVVLSCLCLFTFPCVWAFRQFPVILKTRMNILGSELYRGFVSLGFAFPEVIFLGQRLLIPIAK